jgi:hypothetical protein
MREIHGSVYMEFVNQLLHLSFLVDLIIVIIFLRSVVLCGNISESMLNKCIQQNDET